MKINCVQRFLTNRLHPGRVHYILASNHIHDVYMTPEYWNLSDEECTCLGAKNYSTYVLARPIPIQVLIISVN